MTWLFALAPPLAVIAASVRVRRYSATHLTAEVTIAGRGFSFSRTADGTWWRLQLRRRCRPARCGDLPDDPPDAGIREPRRPHDPAPLPAAVGLEPAR